MKKVIVLTTNKTLQERLTEVFESNFQVAFTEDIEGLNSILKKPDFVGAVIIHIENSRSWMSFNLVGTGYINTPLFAIIDNEDASDDELQQRAKDAGARAVFAESNLTALSTLLTISLASPVEISVPDVNAQFLKLYGDISRELQRLQGEFVETGLRTLPQPLIANDTHNRLKTTLITLRGVSINP